MLITRPLIESRVSIIGLVDQRLLQEAALAGSAQRHRRRPNVTETGETQRGLRKGGVGGGLICIIRLNDMISNKVRKKIFLRTRVSRMREKVFYYLRRETRQSRKCERAACEIRRAKKKITF